MPPKNSTLKKAENKKKDKVLEDKTFGLKNKKGGKAQKYIANVEKQVKGGGNPELRKLEQEREKAKKDKELKEKELKETQSLFKSVQAAQKVDDGVDPKTVFCAFFKQKLCKKGDRCKFSHDPEVERKAAKRNIYEAKKDEDDNMDEWDEDKLAEVVNKKHANEKPANATAIICKDFLDAVENNKYGWFWECPTGGKTCKYKHALPPDFVLKKDKKAKEKETDGITMEDLIEKERALLDSSKCTKVTLETFVAWKKKKLKEKAMAEKKDKDKKKKDLKSGTTSGMSGRDMFLLDPSMLTQHEEEAEEDDGEFDLNMREQDDDMGVKVHEIKFDAYGIMDDGVDDSTEVQLAKARGEEPGASAAAAAVDVDEDLFDDEDLDDLGDELDDLEI